LGAVGEDAAAKLKKKNFRAKIPEGDYSCLGRAWLKKGAESRSGKSGFHARQSSHHLPLGERRCIYFKEKSGDPGKRWKGRKVKGDMKEKRTIGSKQQKKGTIRSPVKKTRDWGLSAEVTLDNL